MKVNRVPSNSNGQRGKRRIRRWLIESLNLKTGQLYSSLPGCALTAKVRMFHDPSKGSLTDGADISMFPDPVGEVSV